MNTGVKINAVVGPGARIVIDPGVINVTLFVNRTYCIFETDDGRWFRQPWIAARGDRRIERRPYSTVVSKPIDFHTDLIVARWGSVAEKTV